MAGRIRSIKPEILEDEKAASLSDAAWRLWVSMWLIADDHGNLRGDSRRLAADVWWAHATSPSVPDLLAELEGKGFARRYEVRGQKYIAIGNWTKHQRIDNAGKPRVPGPSEDERDENPAETLGENPRVSETRRSDHDHDQRRGSTTDALDRARTRVDELKAVLSKNWCAWGTKVLMPDGLTLEAVARLLVIYADAAGEDDLAALAERAVAAFLKLLASWSFTGSATPAMFVKKWDEIQAVLGGVEPGKKRVAAIGGARKHSDGIGAQPVTKEEEY